MTRFDMAFVRLTPIALVLTAACYKSHDVPWEADDAGSAVDAPNDIATFDVARPDSARPDSARPDSALSDALPDTVDAGDECRYFLLDEQTIDWPTSDCGPTTHPEVAAVDGGFQLLVTEQRGCRDRASWLLTRHVSTVDDRLIVGDEEAIGDVVGPGHLAGNGAEFGVCSGDTLHVRSPLEAFQGPLNADVTPSPGCPRFIECDELVADGAGWGVRWRRFDCDLWLSEVGRVGPRGDLRGPSFTVATSLTSISEAPEGLAALSEPRRGTYSFHLWERTAPEPSEVVLSAIRSSSGPSALSPWPAIPGAWALVFVDATSTLHLHVFDEGGVLLLEQNHPAAVEGYTPWSVQVESTEDGLAVGVGYGWGGGRIDSAARVMILGEDGNVVIDEPHRDFGSATIPIDIAVSGRQVLVHRKLVDERNDVSTLASLYVCE